MRRKTIYNHIHRRTRKKTRAETTIFLSASAPEIPLASELLPGSLCAQAALPESSKPWQSQLYVGLLQSPINFTTGYYNTRRHSRRIPEVHHRKLQETIITVNFSFFSFSSWSIGRRSTKVQWQSQHLNFRSIVSPCGIFLHQILRRSSQQSLK